MKHKTIQQLRGMGEQIQGGNEMSELKARLLGQTMNEYGCDTKIYLKSEADKVIADLEMKLAMAQQVLRLNKPEALFSNLDTMSRLSHEIDVVARRERHRKYKHCLDNAWWCRKSNKAYAWSASNLRGWKIAVYYDKKAELYRKWHKRWLKIAEQFKEAKDDDSVSFIEADLKLLTDRKTLLTNRIKDLLDKT